MSNPRPCPECKSHNTRQMDASRNTDMAYCLSCYNKFRSVLRVDIKPRIESIKKDDRQLDKIKERLDRLERSVEEIKAQITMIETNIK